MVIMLGALKRLIGRFEIVIKPYTDNLDGSAEYMKVLQGLVSEPFLSPSERKALRKRKMAI
ncbi:MAG: hypothetical protein ABH863_03610 [Candidatus Micrarchaeota archaeon]